MTTVRWTKPASEDFLGIVEWLHERNPRAARAVGEHILAAVQLLEEHPYLGTPGRSPDTRELGVARFPYLIVHAVASDIGDAAQVAILRVLHGAMLWPPKADEQTA